MYFFIVVLHIQLVRRPNDTTVFQMWHNKTAVQHLQYMQVSEGFRNSEEETQCTEGLITNFLDMCLPAQRRIKSNSKILHFCCLGQRYPLIEFFTIELMSKWKVTKTHLSRLRDIKLSLQRLSIMFMSFFYNSYFMARGNLSI